jgi:hypothetical protein
MDKEKITSLPFKWGLVTATVVNIGFTILILTFLPKLPQEVPLLYGLPEGEEQLVPAWALTLPNLSAFLITIVNITLSLLIKDNLAKKALLLTGIIVTLLATITTIKIATLVLGI